jgi:hypothetical protein
VIQFEKFGHFMTRLALVASLLVPMFGQVTAQDMKPALVVSLSGTEEQISDVMYAATAIGMGDQVQAFAGLVPVLLNGIDMKKPAGLYLQAAGGEPYSVAFIPVTNLQQIFKTHADRVGKPEDVGDGVVRIQGGPGNDIYVKEANGFAFLSDKKENLGACPVDPLVLLGDLPKQYNIGIQVNVRDIPEELRKMAISTMEQAMQQGLENAPDSPDKEFSQAMAPISMNQIRRIIEEVKTFTIGLNIDPVTKGIFLDGVLVPVEGTGLSRQVAGLKETTSNFAGLLMEGASVVALTSSQMAQEDIETNGQLIDLFQKRFEKEIEDDAGLDAAARATAKELIGEVFAVLSDTVKAGKLDYGATLMLQDKNINFAGGVLVSDGKKLEASFAKLVELAKNEPDFPEVKLSVGNHAGVTLHTVNAKVDDFEAQQIFGDKLEITIGTGDKTIWVAFGKDGQMLMKKAMDDCAAKAQENVLPGQVNIYLKPIMKFAAAMDGGNNSVLQKIATSFEAAPKGDDEIRIFTTAVNPTTLRSRLQINEGVLRLIGEAIKASQGG